MVRPKHDSIMATRVDGRLQPRLAVDDSIEVDVRLQHVPDIALRTWLVAAVGDEVSLVCDAGLDAPREEGQRAARVGEQDAQAGESVEDPGQEGTRYGDGRFEREAQRQGQHVSCAAECVGAAEAAGWEAVVRV